MTGEDDVVEITNGAGTWHAIVATGLDLAMLRTRSAFIHGRLDVDAFEAEVERLLHKRERLYTGS